MREMRVGPQDRVSLRAALDHPGGRRESRLVMLVFGLRTLKTSVGAPACGEVLPCHSVSLALWRRFGALCSSSRASSTSCPRQSGFVGFRRPRT